MKKLLLIAAILLAVGSIVALIGFALNGFSFPTMGKAETNTHKITEPFSHISIETTTADVRIALSEDGKVFVVCEERDKLKHTVSVKENTLTIRLKDSLKWYEQIGFFFTRMRITVYLPASTYETLTVQLDTGSTAIPTGFSFRSADIETDTGNVEFYANVENRLSIETDTGHITASGLQCETVKLETDTGRITLTDASCSDLKAETDTGAVKLKNTVVLGQLNVRTSTGDVHLEKSDAQEIYIKTSTGDVSGTLLTDKVFLTETSTGDVRVPKTTTGGRCEITTSTGDITFDSAPIPEEVFQTAPLPDEIGE